MNTSLTTDEQKIIDLQKAKPVFARYGDFELLTEVQVLLYKIAVITGWKIPDDERFSSVLADQFFKKIRESYQDLNAAEVEHAFRQNTLVKDWGKSFNLALIDEVLIPYCNKRSEIKEFIERLPQQEKALPMQADWRELCQLNYEQYLSSNYDMRRWPWQMYDEFVKRGMMAADVYQDFLQVAYDALMKRNIENQREKESKNEIKNEGLKHYFVIENAKRLAVKYLYFRAKKMQLKQIF